jgi:hypothetical protein
MMSIMAHIQAANIMRYWLSNLALKHIETHSAAASRLDRVASNSTPGSIL